MISKEEKERIEYAILRRKLETGKFSKAELAKELNIRAPYITNALKGKFVKNNNKFEKMLLDWCDKEDEKYKN